LFTQKNRVLLSFIRNTYFYPILSMTLPEKRNREPFSSFALYKFSTWSFLAPLLYTYFRGRVYGVEKVPLSGPLVVVSNHGSYFDPPLISISLGRPLAFMAKEELFQVPVLKDIITLYGAYPVKRGASDRNALRSAIAASDRGWAIGIFLEGTRTVDGKIHDPKLGAALIAAKVQAPILPVSFWGSHEILPKGSKFPRSVPLTLRVGDPIAPPNSTKKPELEAVTQKAASIINKMLDLGR
jgi:1-acyl-sn-glycerol-3-phosphate acyltransferase